MILWDYRCSRCDFQEERLVKPDQSDAQKCSVCDEIMAKILSPNPGWLPSSERTVAMLKKRSQDHTRKCNEKGISLADNDSGISSDPVWRNKTRAKNTRKDTIDHFKNVHKTWTQLPKTQILG